MAHDLSIVDGKPEMMYVGQPPWHGLGTQLAEPATAAEAIKAAHLDWKVAKKPVYAIEGKGSIALDDHFAVVREDAWGKPDCPVLGVVGPNYRPLQNKDAFAFFDPIVGEKAAVYHTAGALGQGRRVWVLAKLPDNIHVVGEDIANKCLLLSNGHDGKSSVQIKFTPIRVVCQNTLTLALQAGPAIRIAHLGNLEERLKQAHKLLGLINTTFDSMAKDFKRMVSVNMTANRLSEYLEEVLPLPREGASERAVRRVFEDRASATRLFEKGRGNSANGVRGTLWAAYNGVAELIDHERFRTLALERLAEAIWFSRGYQIKARAYVIANQKARAWLN